MIECGDLIRALRCTKNENDDCHTCKYQVLHEGLHDYCDRDALENEAAEVEQGKNAGGSDSTAGTMRRER